MELLMIRSLPRLLPLFAVVISTAAFDAGPSSFKTANETAMTPRVSAMFAKTKTVCFGRFLIDVPTDTQVAWGATDVPLGVSVIEDEAKNIARRINEREQQLKSEDRFPASKKLSLYFETIDEGTAGVKHVVSQQDFTSEGMLRINSFFAMGTSLVLLDALPLEEDKRDTLKQLDDIAHRLRPQTDTDVPAEPGVCIEHAFLPDVPGTGLEEVNEHIQVGFRLAEFTDTHLSIYVAPANPYDPGNDSLESQLEETEADASKSGQPNPYAKLTTFRRGKRSIHDWTTGFEFLTRSPKSEKTQSYHTFWMKFTGESKNPLRPYADILMQTGVKDDIAGLTVPTLTDEEAIAVWDKITSSIRVRPTGAKVGANGLPIKAAIGERATTGRKCPQAGWWECVDELPFAEPRGSFFCEGDPMPGIQVWSKPTALDRLRGKRRQHRVPTEWRLTSYDGPSKASSTAHGSAGTLDSTREPGTFS